MLGRSKGSLQPSAFPFGPTEATDAPAAIPESTLNRRSYRAGMENQQSREDRATSRIACYETVRQYAIVTARGTDP